MRIDPLDADLLDLERKAQEASGKLGWEHAMKLLAGRGVDTTAEYVAAVHPKVVLELLERLRHKQVVINALATAPGGDER